MAHRPDPNDFAFMAAMTEDEFRRLFQERFGREYDGQEPFVSLSEEEFEFVMGYAFRETSGFLWQFTYSDPVTGLTYEVFYDVDIDQDKAVVAYALLGEEKVRLTRGLRQRMTLAAFEQWLKEFHEENLMDGLDTSFAFRS